MRLQDLGELARIAITRYRNEYSCRDIKLHDSFKTTFSVYLDRKGNKIQYFDYTAKITVGQSTQKIFLPNQWFAIATFFVEFTMEILKYKEFIKSIPKNIVSDDEVKKLKGSSTLDGKLQAYIDEQFGDEQQSCEYVRKFLTDYDWWHGSKTIDRTDFYNSPVLNMMEVVNVSQSYLADIVYAYTNDRALMEEAFQLREVVVASAELDIGQGEASATQERCSGAYNLIVYGAPGTGKSHYLKQLAEDKNTVRVTFHPEYTYHDFVGSYKPVPLYRNEKNSFLNAAGNEIKIGEPLIDYQFVPGPFSLSIQKAISQPNVMHTIIIEELNRANAAAVFGDVFQLLDRDESGESEYRIIPDIELGNYLKKNIPDFEGELYIPRNLNILATMNSADQGVTVLDSAFKRRWNFKYMAVDFENCSHRAKAVDYGAKKVEWETLVTEINNKLTSLKINEDRHIGPYFMRNSDLSINECIASKLLIYLWDDVVRHHRPSFFKDIHTFADLGSRYLKGDEIFNFAIAYIKNIEEGSDVGDNAENADEDDEIENISDTDGIER